MAFNFNEYNNNYKKEHYDRIQLLLRKGAREKLDELARKQGKRTVSQLIKDALHHYMEDVGEEKIEL